MLRRRLGGGSGGSRKDTADELSTDIDWKDVTHNLTVRVRNTTELRCPLVLKGVTMRHAACYTYVMLLLHDALFDM